MIIFPERQHLFDQQRGASSIAKGTSLMGKHVMPVSPGEMGSFSYCTDGVDVDLPAGSVDYP